MDDELFREQPGKGHGRPYLKEVTRLSSTSVFISPHLPHIKNDTRQTLRQKSAGQNQ